MGFLIAVPEVKFYALWEPISPMAPDSGVVATPGSCGLVMRALRYSVEGPTYHMGVTNCR